jgi:hypothetical protein
MCLAQPPRFDEEYLRCRQTEIPNERPRYSQPIIKAMFDCSHQAAETAEEREARLYRWAERLAESVSAVLQEHPDADPDNVRHALILLEYPPIERLRRSLTRGRGALRRK